MERKQIAAKIVSGILALLSLRTAVLLWGVLDDTPFTELAARQQFTIVASGLFVLVGMLAAKWIWEGDRKGLFALVIAMTLSLAAQIVAALHQGRNGAELLAGLGMPVLFYLLLISVTWQSQRTRDS